MHFTVGVREGATCNASFHVPERPNIKTKIISEYTLMSYISSSQMNGKELTQFYVEITKCMYTDQ